MKKTSLLLLFLISISVYSQKLEWGKEYESKNKIVEIISSNEKIYTFSQSKKEKFIDVFDLKLKKLKSTKLETKNNILEFIELDKKISLISYKYDRKTKTITIYKNDIDNNGKMNSNSKILFKETRKSRKENVNFKFVKSPNKEYILIASYVFNKEGGIDLKFFTFNNKYKLLEENSYKLKNNEETNIVVNINDDGKYFCLNQSFEFKKSLILSHKIELIQFDKEGSVTSKKNLPCEGIFVKNIKLTNMSNGNLLISSIYSLPDNKGKFYYPYTNNGILNCVYNPKTQSVVNQVKNKISEEFILDYINKEKFKEKYRGYVFLSGLKDYIETENGFYIVDEYSYTTFQSTTTVNVTSTYFNNISVFFFDFNGNLKWESCVNKTQVESKTSPKFGAVMGGISGSIAIGKFGSNQTQFYSYCPILKGNDLVLIYNDNPKNLNKKEFKRPAVLKNFKKGVSLTVTIDNKNGSQLKKVIKNNQNVILAPKVFFELDLNTYILYSERKKIKKLVYLTL